MILTIPNFKIQPINPDEILQSLEEAGRTCYLSRPKGKPEDFIEMIIRNGHESVLEHEKITVRIICDRGVSHELVRHRIASYSQESTRYCDYNGGLTFIIPPWCDILPGEYSTHPVDEPDACLALAAGDPETYGCAMVMAYAEQTYKGLREDGWKPEQARSVLPNSLKTEIVITANLREWRHILRLRTAPSAHPQAREIFVPLLLEMKRLLPIVFDDIGGRKCYGSIRTQT